MFKGFSPETVDFLWGIRLNNNREWFLANKKQYVDTLYEPMKALGKELYQTLEGRSGDLCKVSRIYRDARMHHSEPYKESLWICIRRDVEWWGENPCLYFEINPEGVHYGFFLWQPRPAVMEAFRRDIAARPDAFLKMLRQVEKATGQRVEAQCYKRPKAAEDPRLAPYFGWQKAIGCVRQEPFSEEVFSPDLANRVGEFLRQLLPIYDYFNQIINDKS